MKNSLYVFFGLVLSFLFLNSTVFAATPPVQLNPNLNKNIQFVTSTPTFTPTPTPETKETVTPSTTGTITPSTTIMPDETGKATDTGTASNAATTPVATGIQTKDIVTYVLIGAILLVLLAQAFWPKKNNTPETKPEEPKTEEPKVE
jgi:hypothetical protein